MQNSEVHVLACLEQIRRCLLLQCNLPAQLTGGAAVVQQEAEILQSPNPITSWILFGVQGSGPECSPAMQRGQELNICRAEVLAGSGPRGLLWRALKSPKLNSQQLFWNQTILSAPSNSPKIHLGQLPSTFPPDPSEHRNKISPVNLSIRPHFVGNRLTP